MRSRGLSPNLISFNAAMSACEKGGQCQRAAPSLNEMRMGSLSPNAISFSAAISACGKGGRWQR
eukprot:3931391-Karenia_brevis.AAC.1